VVGYPQHRLVHPARHLSGAVVQGELVLPVVRQDEGVAEGEAPEVGVAGVGVVLVSLVVGSEVGTWNCRYPPLVLYLTPGNKLRYVMNTHHGGHLRDWEEWIQPKPLLLRLTEKTKPGPIPRSRPDLGACIIWTGYTTHEGYGCISITKRKVLAHRFAYELLRGEIPTGMDIDHLCSTKNCVNPAHMEPVTRRENFRRANTNEDKTHCPQGHPYSPENTILKKGRYGFRRHCKECARIEETKRRIGSPYPNRWRRSKNP
jgi:hypothetical protein